MKKAIDAANGYVYGYPLVLMDVTREVMLNREATAERPRTVISQFANIAAPSRMPASRMSCGPISTRCTPSHGSTSRKSRS